MEPTINRWDVLQQMDTGQPFDLSFVTCDRRRGTGGELKQVSNYVKYKGETISPRTMGRGKFNQPQRNPQHAIHKTVNIYNPHDSRQHPYTVHWRLMCFFNGKRIVQ